MERRGDRFFFPVLTSKNVKGKRRRRVVKWKTHQYLGKSSQAQQENKMPKCPTSPTPKGKGGDVRGWCRGVGTDHRAPRGPMLGLSVGRAMGGEDREAGAPGCVAEEIFADRSSLFGVCLHLLMCCLSMEKTVKLSNGELPR